VRPGLRGAHPPPRIIALPSFLFATSRIISGYVGGLSGVHAMWAGADWTWHQAARRNDEISTEACSRT